ncbi:MAG: SPOR domain-containing protein [Candidatus Marinimicrobia bacterium]|nr:SPOR domain-containing protein [Candidatus Neomarinimicrobiota bacterium]
MTCIVHAKRITVSLLLISIIVSCNMWKSQFGRDEIYLGEYVTLQVEEPVEGQVTRWIFAQLPDSSKLGGFLPADTFSQVSFKPDVPGEYDVILELTVNGKTAETSYFYDAVIPEDSSLISSAVPSHLLDMAYLGDTTVADTPAVSSRTDTGDQRRYLSKVITPGQPKTQAARRSSRGSKRTNKAVSSKPSRGNLIPRAAKTFTIQVSSWPSLNEAQEASQELSDKYGIDSYIQRAFFKDKDEIYYRLRIGNFEEQAVAQAYAKEIQAMTSLPVWVDFVRQEM